MKKRMVLVKYVCSVCLISLVKLVMLDLTPAASVTLQTADETFSDVMQIVQLLHFNLKT